MTQSRKAKCHTARTMKKSVKRRQALKTAPPTARVKGARQQSPGYTSKSNELIPFRLEHHKDETKRILPRPERGMKVLALNGQMIEYRRAA